MTARQKDAARWASSCAETVKSLDTEESNLIHTLETHDKSLKFISKLQKDSTVLSQEDTLSRVQKMCLVLKPLATAADNLSQSIPKPSNLIWAMLGLSIRACSTREDLIRVTLETFEVLLSVAPKFENYVDLLSKSTSLERAIEEVFTAYMSLSRQCLKKYGRNNPLRQISWIRFQRSFPEKIKKIRTFSEKSRSEVGVEPERRSSQPAEEKFRKIVAEHQDALAIQNQKQLPLSKNLQDIEIAPHPPNPGFTGRRSELEDIHRALRPPDPVLTRGQKTVAICGLSGVGKSQLALQYFYSYPKSYKFRLWITCDSTVRMDGDIAVIVKELGYPPLGLSQNREHFRSWFANAGKDCLLVLDNADNIPEILSFWPGSSEGSILLTSQNSSWVHRENISRGISLKSLSDLDSLDFLRSIMSKQGKSIEDGKAAAIVKETGGLPLALRHIGSYICAMNMDPSDFLEEYRDEDEASAIDAWDESVPPWYSHTLSTFLNYAFSQLTGDAIALLAVVVFLDPERISDSLFSPKVEPTRLWVKSRYNAAVRNCLQYEFLSKDVHGILSIHRQVRTYLRHKLDATQIRDGCSLAFRSLRHVFPHQSVIAEPLSLQWDQCAPWIEHLIALADGINRFSQKFDTFDIPVDVASLLVDGAIYLWERGLLDEGRNLTLTAKDIVEGRVCDQNLVANVYSFHGCILSDSGQLEEALKFFELEKDKRMERLKTGRNSNQPGDIFDQIRLANAYNNLAGVCCSLRKFGDAMVYNEMSLKIKQHGAKTLDVSYLQSLSYQNFGILYGQTGEYDKAEEFFKKAIELGANTDYTLRTALTYHNYGCMDYLRGRIESAKDHFEMAYELRQTSLGDHYDTAATLHMLAGCYYSVQDEESFLQAR
ncbi:unnamed protein product [Alternaria alternata]